LVFLGTDQIERLEADQSTVRQATALTVTELILRNGSVWHQEGQALTVSDRYRFEQSTFNQTGLWQRPEGNDSLTVTGFSVTLSGAHHFDRLEIGSGGSLQVQGYDAAVPDSGHLQLTVNDLVIAAGGKLSATGRGYGSVE